ncbi:DUF6686 family protein [Confluentibacter sediminis]|uniref:DUF6686 family protein n=1 Tax=Confluentibacter sediminis TaxID=2219045 RepID=UPI000DAE44B8|nr:DUF6686 family protein [Confluentibacter sediminis]
MCHSLVTISKVKSGELTFCNTCNSYHLEFNNLYFELNSIQFIKLKNFLLEIDIAYWEINYAHTGFKRKIPITSMNQNIVLMFNRQEIEELKTLVLKKKTALFLNVDDIDYQFILN